MLTAMSQQLNYVGISMVLVAISHHLESNVANHEILVLVISTMLDGMCILRHCKPMRLPDSTVMVVFI